MPEENRTAPRMDNAVSCRFSEDLVDRAWNLISKAKLITVLSHKGADADAICSSAAISDFLQRLGKKVETILPDKPHMKLFYKPVGLRVGSHSCVPDLIIALDVAERPRMYCPDEFRDVPLINIDHHRGNSVGGTIDLVDAQASSACEVLCGLMESWQPNLVNKFVAEALLCGLLDDSIIFRTHLSTAETLRAAVYLVSKGADFPKARKMVLTYKSPFVVRFWGFISSKMKVISGKSMVVASVSLSDFDRFSTDKSVLGGFVNFLAGTLNSDIVLLLVEKESGMVKGSFRSKRTDVAVIAESLGGGGHKHAAGFDIQGSLGEVEAAVVKLL